MEYLFVVYRCDRVATEGKGKSGYVKRCCVGVGRRWISETGGKEKNNMRADHCIPTRVAHPFPLIPQGGWIELTRKRSRWIPSTDTAQRVGLGSESSCSTLGCGVGTPTSKRGAVWQASTSRLAISHASLGPIPLPRVLRGMVSSVHMLNGRRSCCFGFGFLGWGSGIGRKFDAVTRLLEF